MNESNLTHQMEPYKGVTGTDIVIARDPEVVLAEAQRAAVALQNVISKKKNPVKFNNEQYLEFEDWQTVAKFYGCTAKVVYTRFVEYGDVRGFEASAVVIDQNGIERSSAEAMCLNDEANWGKRTKFAWKKREDLRQGEEVAGEYQEKVKVKIGEEQVPLFQLRSMAQTRACAKALRNVFSWVVVLAGYQPTPAEELTGTEIPNGHAPKSTQAPTPSVRPPQPKKANGTPPSADQSELPKHTVKNVTTKHGVKDGKEWTKYTITTDHGTYNTFSDSFGNASEFAWESNFPVRLTFKDTGKYGNELLTLEVIEEVQAEPVQGALEGSPM